MPPQTLAVPYSTFIARNHQHGRIAAALPGLEPTLQKALAELILIRLSDDLQEALAGIAYRLACGTSYLDGSSPTLLVPKARSTDSARRLFEEQGRTKSKPAKWSRMKYIRQTTEHVMSGGELFIRTCDSHALTLSEIQAVRNRIAHKNTNSRNKFNPVVRRYYGAVPKNVSPGLLLLTPRISPTPLEFYLAATRIIVRDCVRA